MDNFGDNVRLDIIKNFNKDFHIKIEENTNRYLLKLYSEILDLCKHYNKIKEAIKIQKEYELSEIKVEKKNYWEKLDLIDSNILNELNIEDNYEFRSRIEENMIIDFLINKYKLALSLELVGFSKEELLIYFYSIGSVLSYISFASNHIYRNSDVEETEVYRNLSNLIIDTMNLFKTEDRVNIYGIIGREKKSCEYIINYILNDKTNYVCLKNRDINLENIFLILNRLFEVIVIKKSVNGSEEIKTRIKDKTLKLHKDIGDKYTDYLYSICDETYNINNKEVEEILSVFRKKEGYCSNILTEYLSSNKISLRIDGILNLVEDKFLYFDISNCTNIKYKNIEKLINSLSLSKVKNDLNLGIFSEDNRLFRTPIIHIGNYLILSYYLLIESNHYLKYRIIRRNLSKDGQIDKRIKKLYDEIELESLKKLVDKYKITGDKNKDLQENNKIRNIICNKKGIKKEIDFYFIFRNILYVIEYKNQDIHTSLKDLNNNYTKNEKNVKRHKKVIEVIESNKQIFKEFLGENFEEIKSFIVFKNKNSFIDYYKDVDTICCTYKDFYEWLNKLLLR